MKKLWMLFSVILVLSCTKKTEPIPLSFYYWKTNFQLTETEKQYLNDLDVVKLYIRYFDISLKDSIAIPIAPVTFSQEVEKYKVVPVVYIKNEVFLHQTATDSLPQKVFNYIQQINKSANVSVNEIQFDCDWSLK